MKNCERRRWLLGHRFACPSVLRLVLTDFWRPAHVKYAARDYLCHQYSSETG